MTFLDAVKEMETGKYMFMSRLGHYVDNYYLGIVYMYEELIPGNKKLHLTFIGKKGVDDTTDIRLGIEEYFANDWLCYDTNIMGNKL